MTSCAGGDDSGFDSDDDSDCGSEDADAGADALLPAPPLSLRESQRKRRSNLPEFKMLSDDQEQEPPPSRAKDLNRNPVALTREELDAVAATFSTAAFDTVSITGSAKVSIGFAWIAARAHAVAVKATGSEARSLANTEKNVCKWRAVVV